jgi:hypothetical protein
MKILDAKVGDIITYNNPKCNKDWIGCKFKVTSVHVHSYELVCVYITERHSTLPFSSIRTRVGEYYVGFDKDRFLDTTKKNHLPKWF